MVSETNLISKFIIKAIVKIKSYGELVMFSHTLFSLPFALISMLIAANGIPEARLIFWILTCLIAGRNGANALNRYVDAEYDLKNPRTRNRHIPAGLVKKNEALYLTLFCYLVFVVGAYNINNICFYLSPLALALFTLYSYTKRFTWLCHVILGITCAGAPVGAWLAVRGQINIEPIAIAAVVSFWVAGFDIIYGTQDIEFDLKEGLFSIPAKFGYQGALWISRVLHTAMWFVLLGLYFITPLGKAYFIAVFLSGALLVVEHIMVDPKSTLKMNIASYHINQLISVLLLSATSVDILF